MDVFEREHSRLLACQPVQPLDESSVQPALESLRVEAGQFGSLGKACESGEMRYRPSHIGVLFLAQELGVGPVRESCAVREAAGLQPANAERSSVLACCLGQS